MPVGQFTLSVVIPAKNEARTIGTIVDGVRSLYPDAEVIVVDDGSSDGTPCPSVACRRKATPSAMRAAIVASSSGGGGA